MSLLDQASWVIVPSQYKEDTVRAFKPTSELGNLAFTRSSDATFTDSTGVVRSSPWNLLQYSEDFNAWVKQQVSISTNVAANPLTGVINADLLLPDTTNNLHRIYSFATVSNSNVLSVYAKASGYNYISLAQSGGVSGSGIIFNLSNGTVSGTVSGFYGTISPAGNGWYLCSLISNQATNNYQNLSRWIIIRDNSTNDTFTGNGTSGVLVANAQLVEGTEALPYFATTDRLNVPRLDYRNADGTLSTCPRLLLEPQRTNSIRNSSMVGAVVGSPGTLPTNWSYLFGTGLTTTVVGTGTENGLPYVDVRFNGTVTTISTEVVTETSSAISASSGQVWSNSAFIKIISATLPPNSYSLKSYYWNGGAYVSESTTPFTPTTTLARYSAAHTVTAGTITHISQSIRMNLTNGAAYDFTIRIAAPQIELGAYATTWVPTTTAAVTRLYDDAIKTGVSSLIGQTEGTIFADVRYEVAQQARIAITDGTVNNWIFFAFPETGTTSRIYIRSSNVVNVDQLVSSIFTANQTYKIALAYKTGNWAFYVNGTQLASGTNSISFNGTFDRIIVNAGGAVTAGIHVYAKYNQAALFPVRLDNATLAALTTL